MRIQQLTPAQASREKNVYSQHGFRAATGSDEKERGTSHLHRVVTQVSDDQRNGSSTCVDQSTLASNPSTTLLRLANGRFS